MDGAYMCQESGRYQGIYTLARRAKNYKKKTTKNPPKKTFGTKRPAGL